ncbi:MULTISPECIES: MalM family protein [Vibrio]|uniref:MalM family protein n=1 Tax=Vibrio TaxID=662 RepID=UPI0020758F98|nr:MULTISPECIES: MalM family protein [Vibrio]USD34497.1 transcriptional regulator [Vibrio sp. SCSIO 43186]USD47565.1 transcriptional regulator [Vibrio sp. SCSIO 43145]USD71622.1 transcriptional regulator [Vibrio sp. SCSIO 43139]USD98525.1 transcriptional regulator [Vibrio coralliilyticus]
MRNSLILLLSGIGLFGCSASSENAQLMEQSLSPVQAQVCCGTSQEFPWIFLKQNEELEFTIDTASPVFDFNTGKSYFAPFAFDSQSGAVELVIRSNMEDNRVAIPVIELLDQDFNTVKTLKRDDFQIKFSDAFARNRFELQISVDTIQTPYMVIYSDNSDLGERIMVPHPAKLRAQETGDPMPIVTDPTYYAANFGSFSVNVKTLTLSGYNQKKLVEQKISSDTKKSPSAQILVPVPETQQYYHQAITAAVESNDLNKAISLLEEAKALNVEGAQEIFVKAVNAKK